MRFGKRRKDAEDATESAEPVSVDSAPPPPAESVTSWTAAEFEDVPRPGAYVEPEPDPVVEGEAVELPAEPVAEPVARPIFEPMPPPVAEAPAAFATGHAPMPGPAWPEPIAQMARERPEYVVGAAFVGGLLAAMILRRLGN